jgi:hypothetical protein
MAGAFHYKPKFVDIRVRPPKPEEEARAADVHQLKPGQRKCDWAGCPAVATAKAPKSRELMNEHYWFCQAHAGEYNKGWDFFAGMSEGEVRAAQEARATGERPTWQFRASRFSREAAAFAAKMGTGNTKGAGAYADPFGIFGAARRRAEAELEARGRRLGRLERQALAEFDLLETADAATIRARYLELVKRFHPDTNGGDRSAEQKLTRVLKAYKTLQNAKLV